MGDYISYSSQYDYDTYDAYSSYSYSRPYTSSRYTKQVPAEGILGLIFGMGLIAWIITIAIFVLTVVGMWKAFVKARHAGWESLIGGHNMFVRFQDSGIKPYWFFLLFVPIANIIVLFWLNIEYAKSFGKGTGFGVGLTLLPYIFFPILGLGRAQYMGPAYHENYYGNQNYNNYYSNDNQQNTKPIDNINNNANDNLNNNPVSNTNNQNINENPINTNENNNNNNL